MMSSMPLQSGVLARPAMHKKMANPITTKRQAISPSCVQAPIRQMQPSTKAPTTIPTTTISTHPLPTFITHDTIRDLESELDHGTSISALRRFNSLLATLPADQWHSKLQPVMHELAFNLESFNPAFTACLLAVQQTIGTSDYVCRDVCLKNLIQPIAGEYGMHNGEAQACTHRELFSMFYQDLLKQPLEDALTINPAPRHSVEFFNQMMSDLNTAGRRNNNNTTTVVDSMTRATYALGYNLAIEYLADYEKTWMLDSFRALNDRVLSPAGRPLTEWVFLEVHAEGEAEHAAIGHAAVAAFVPAVAEGELRRAMMDHDRDFAAFYNAMADMLESISL